jgi:DNA-binding response OmpR family regulator
MRSKIMVVEDTTDLSAVLIDLLETQGYGVVHATEGRSAVEMAKLEKPNLILLDLMIPEMDGFQVCKKLREQPETRFIKVIILSSLYRKRDMIEAFAAGASEFLVKPFDNKRLLETVRSLLNGSQRP